MDIEKLTYPEIFTIDGVAHKGKRRMSKGQLLIPYTNAPSVGIGDVVAQKAGKKEIYLKVTEASFIKDGSLGVGTEHPHLLTLKVANTTDPSMEKKPSSATRSDPVPRKIIQVGKKRAKTVKKKIQPPVKRDAKSSGEEDTVASIETNKHGFQRRVTKTYFEGKFQLKDVEETLASIQLPKVDAFRGPYPVGIPPTSVRTVELVCRSTKNIIDGIETTKVEYFHKFPDKPFLDKVGEETYGGDALLNVKDFHGNGQIKGNYQYLRRDPNVVKCFMFRKNGTKGKELTTWYRMDGTKERERETTFDEEGNRSGRETRTYDADGKLILKPDTSGGET